MFANSIPFSFILMILSNHTWLAFSSPPSRRSDCSMSDSHQRNSPLNFGRSSHNSPVNNNSVQSSSCRYIIRKNLNQREPVKLQIFGLVRLNSYLFIFRYSSVNNNRLDSKSAAERLLQQCLVPLQASKSSTDPQEALFKCKLCQKVEPTSRCVVIFCYLWIQPDGLVLIYNFFHSPGFIEIRRMSVSWHISQTNP